MKMKTVKVYTIKTDKITGRGNRPNSENVWTGTLEELIKMFSYTLEIGASWNKKISREPKTIKSFLKNLQMSFEEKEANCYDRTNVELVSVGSLSTPIKES